MKATGRKYSDETLLMACILDAVNILKWQNTEDGHKGRNVPDSVYRAMMEESKPKQKEFETFGSSEEFEARWKALTGNE